MFKPISYLLISIAFFLFGNKFLSKRFLLLFSFTSSLLVSANSFATVTYPTPNVFVVGVTASISPGGTTTTGTFSVSTNAAILTSVGLSINATTGVISGTPTATHVAFNIKVTRGATVSGNISITVLAAPAITYTPSTNAYTLGVPITAWTPTNSGIINSPAYNNSTVFYATGAGSVPLTVQSDANGNIFTADQTSGHIFKIAPGGSPVTTLPTTIPSIANIAIDTINSFIYASAGGTNVYQLDAGGTTVLQTFTGFTTAFGLVVDIDGNVFVADGGAGNVKEIPAGATSSAGITTFVTTTAPYGIAIDANGNMFISSNTANTVVKIASGTQTVTTNFSTTGLNQPRNLTTDATGTIYVADNGTGTIRKIASTGGGATSFYTNGLAAGGAFDICFDLLGNMFIANKNGPNILTATPSGGYFISANLPSGLAFSNTTGRISGTPTSTSVATPYIVSGTSNNGNANTTINIAVNDISIPTVTGGGTFCSNSTTLTASGGTPAGGTYKWYNAASGGSSLGTGTTFTTTLSGTFYATYTPPTGTIESNRSTGTVVALNGTIGVIPSTTTLAESYPFNGNANDVSGTGNNGVFVGTPTAATDQYGNSNGAYTFDGTSQYMHINTSIAGPPTFSISLWFKTAAAYNKGGALIGFDTAPTGTGGTADRLIYMDNTGLIHFGILKTNTKNQIASTNTYNDGNWHHIVATASTSTGAFLYIDDVLQNSSATQTSNKTTAGYWRIADDILTTWGSASTSNFFAGTISDVQFFTTALSLAEGIGLDGATSNSSEGSLPASQLCEGAGVILQLTAATVQGATAYSWTGPNGFTSTLQNPTITDVTAAATGSYILTVTTGCSSSQAEANVVVNASSTAIISAASNVAVATNTPISTSSTGSSYAWTFPGGTPATSTAQNPGNVQWATAGIKTITLTVTNASGCATTSSQNITVGTGFGSYAMVMPITVTTGTLGVTATPLLNFPLLVKITDPTLISIPGNCNNIIQFPTGPFYDFGFVDPGTGNEVPYEVESYDATNGVLVAWVQMPSLSTATNANKINFVYGATSIPSVHTAAFYKSTWASDYLAVYHFNEGSTSGASTIKDATSHGNDATPTNTTVTTGQVGGAYTFNGSTSKITSSASADPAGSFTVSAWIKLGATGLSQTVLTNENATGGGYKLYFATGGNNNKPLIDEKNGTNAAKTGIGSATINTTTSNYIAGVYSTTANTVQMYLNGAGGATVTATTDPTAAGPINIGVGPAGTGTNFNGMIDEVRISTAVKSTNWLLVEYNNLHDYAIGTSYLTQGSIVATNAAATIKGALSYTWTGTTSGDMRTAGNWSTNTPGANGTLPALDGSATLDIPNTTTPPTLLADASVYGLTVESGASINLNGHMLTVGCNVVNSAGGQILYGGSNSSGLTFASTAAQTYTGSNTAGTAKLGNLTINNAAGVTINGGPVDVYNALTLAANNTLTVGTSPAALTLKSTASQSAYVAALPTGASIGGTVNVERFVTGGAGMRGYRLLSSPVFIGNVSPNNVYSLNYIANSSYLTGETTSAGGIDKVGNPTLFLFRENVTPNSRSFVTGNFRGIGYMGTNGISNFDYSVSLDGSGFNVPVGNGFLFFFRGDRNVAPITTETITSYIPTNTIFTASGTLNQGNITVHNWFTPGSANLLYTNTTTPPPGNATIQGYNLVGNPYASAISWTSVYAGSTNVSASAYEFNPITNQYGSYVQGSGAGTGGFGDVIASGQGFFTIASNGTAAVNFSESNKVSSQPSTLLMGLPVGGTSPQQQQYMHLKLIKDAINYDDIIIAFKPGTDSKYSINEDGLHLTGNSPPETLTSLSSDSVGLSVNYMPLPKGASQTIKLVVDATVSGIYTLSKTEFVGIPALYGVWLKDNLLKDSLDLRANSTYSFTIDKTDPTTFGTGRFQIVVRENPALGLHLLDFKADKVTGLNTRQVKVSWTVENEANYTTFYVQRSTDGGLTFQSIGSLQSDGSGTYVFVDKSPSANQNQYRLQLSDADNVITYSSIITVNYNSVIDPIEAIIAVYPNPVHDVVNIGVWDLTGLTNSLTITITNSYGMVVRSTASAQILWQTNVNGLLPGTYFIQVVDNKSKMVIGRSKFVKL